MSLLEKFLQWADEIVTSPFLKKKKTLEQMSNELIRILLDFDSLEKEILKKQLRSFKYKEYLRITVRDLAELCPFEETLEELSAVAISCLDLALFFRYLLCSSFL